MDEYSMDVRVRDLFGLWRIIYAEGLLWRKF